MFSEINYDLPTCDFITLTKEEPFNDKKFDYGNYLNILDLDVNSNSWVCNELPGLYLKLLPDKNNINSNIMLTGNVKNLFSSIENIRFYGGKNKFGLTNYLRYIDHTLIIWVFYTLLNTYKYHLSKLRDEIAKVNFLDSSIAIEKIKNIKKDFIKLESNIPYFIKEFERYKKIDTIPFEDDIFEFIPNWDHQKNNEDNLFKDIFNLIIDNLALLENQYINVKKSLYSNSNLISAIISDKLSKRNMWIQISMMSMTAIMLILTAIMLYESLQNVG
ncbi:hypothetical protein [Halanaerobium praevalens]|nr:hypothetical protein [Halanaerobium praevalens]ADO77515.1 hypothetical protein Hprae_1385 [Halanaerobium praevalens DSM 2228]